MYIKSADSSIITISTTLTVGVSIPTFSGTNDRWIPTCLTYLLTYVYS